MQENFRYLFCQRVSSTAFVPHVSYKGTATAFVRVNLADEEGGVEISEGGKMEQGACRELFLRQIKESTQAVVQKLKARKPAAVNVPQVVKAGLAAAAGPKAPAAASAKAILQGLQKKASSLAPGAEDAGTEGARGARGAE